MLSLSFASLVFGSKTIFPTDILSTYLLLAKEKSIVTPKHSVGQMSVNKMFCWPNDRAICLLTKCHMDK